MFRTTLLVTLTLVFLAAHGLAQGAAAPATGQADANLYTRGPFEIGWDPALPRPEADAVSAAILRWAPEAALATVRPLADSPAEVNRLTKRLIDSTKITVTGDRFELRIAVDTRALDKPEPVREYADQLANNLSRPLKRLSEDAEQTLLKKLTLESEARRERVHDVDENLLRIRRDLRQTANIVDVTPEGVRAAVGHIEQEKQKLALDLAGQNARQGALEKALARVAKQADERVKTDDVATQLAKIVSVREQEVKRLRQMAAAATVAEAEVQRAETELAEAAAKLLERRETASRNAGGELLTELNKELLMLSINTAETQARLEHLEKTLAGFKPALDTLDKMELLQSERARTQNDLSRMEDMLSNLRAQVTMPHSGPVVREKVKQ